jgi:hypothetical protein
MPLKLGINALTLFTQSTNAYTGLLAAHNEVWMVLRHFVGKIDGRGTKEKRKQYVVKKYHIMHNSSRLFTANFFRLIM